MPLITRTVTPIDVSRNRLNSSVQSDELECVANGTLSNLIRQLSSLSSHAEQIFREIHHETVKLDHKTNTLFLRVERLSQKVLNAELDNEQVGIEDIHLRKAFKSTNLIDQHSLDRQTLPMYLSELYVLCDSPPQLDILNPYRDEKKSALRYYTDPSYFFDLWKEEMLKECGSDVRRNRAKSPNIQSSRSMEMQNKSPGRRRKNRHTNQTSPLHQATTSQANVLVSHYSGMARQQYPSAQYATDFMNFPSEYQAPQFLRPTGAHAKLTEPLPPPPGMTLQHKDVYDTATHAQRYAPTQNYVPNTNQSQASAIQTHANGTNGMNQQLQGLRLDSNFGIDDLADIDDDLLPPPPPPLQSITLTINEGLPISTNQSNNSHLHFVPANGIDAPPPSHMTTVTNAPPPPPPPPPPGIVSSSFATKISDKEAEMEKSILVDNLSDSQANDHRTNLLMEIQSGIKLKKVQRQEELASEKAAIETQNDVAAILRRRMEHVLGNDDSSESPEDDNEWDDD